MILKHITDLHLIDSQSNSNIVNDLCTDSGKQKTITYMIKSLTQTPIYRSLVFCCYLS